MNKSIFSLALAASLAMPLAHGQQLSDGVLRIGVLNDQTSIYSYGTGQSSVAAVRMAIEDFGGKVLGKPVELIVADHLNKPDVASSIARRWFDNEKIDAIADLTSSGAALAVQEIARSANRTLLIASAASSELTGKACLETSTQWTYDTYALAKGTASAIVKQGNSDTWFFITNDYAFGHALERDTREFVQQSGGKTVSGVRAPANTADFSSFLLAAQASKAKIIALATSGPDTINSIKQAAEFGVVAGGQRLAGLLIYDNDVDALGLKAAQGLMLTSSFYWDLTPDTRNWTKRFMDKTGGKLPNMMQAGVYAATYHYLKAIQAAGTDEAKAVAVKMRELPVNDFYNKNVRIREDGRVMHNMYLLQVKAPQESKSRYDLYKVLATIPAEQAFRPLSESACPIVKK